MDPKDQKVEDDIDNFEEDIDTTKDEEDEEGNDSEKNNTGSENEEDPEEDPQGDDDEEGKGYRPKDSEPEEKQVVPLKKYLKLKAKLQKATADDDSLELNEDALESFAEESNLDIKVVKKLAKVLTSQATKAATKAAEEKLAPLVLEKISKDNLAAFEADFEKSIASKYPELATKKDVFKKIAFSKDFLHLKNLEAIRAEFYPGSKPAGKKAKDESIEGGSKGAGKESITKVDFATLKSNPEEYAKVMSNPEAKKKYYEWQDAQGL